MQNSHSLKHGDPCENAIQFIQNIVKQGGPKQSAYVELEKSMTIVAQSLANNLIDKSQVEQMISELDFLKTRKTVMGHIRIKPYGYAGDFEIIDRIYQQSVCSDDKFEKWDRFSISRSAAKAVRNRKEYFKKFIIAEMKASSGELSLLNVASGPARDIFELYEEVDCHNLSTTCVDYDKNAIEFAENLNAGNRRQIKFLHKNIFRFKAEQQFDLVWSAGLFDYFNDDAFVRILRKFLSWVRPGGKIVVGNFSLVNPSRAYMELIGDWYLEHRSEEKLIDLAIQAGGRKEKVFVEYEPEGVNLFLHLWL